MIYTVTFNPAIDYVVRLDAPLEVGEVNRAKGEDCVLGGKGINVSGVLAQLGCESVALGFVAGETGAWLERGLAAQGLKTDFVHLEQGMTRINVKIKAGQETELNGAGSDIPESAMQELEKKLEHLAELKDQASALRQIISENDRIREEIAAIELAQDTLKELSMSIRDSFGLYLNKTASELISGITGGLYTSMSIDENLGAFLNTRRKLIPLEQVSSGTADQIYLALRLAAARFIQNGQDSMPLIFDDSFILYDDDRLRQALRWLSEAYKGQIIIFTCHRRELDILEEEEIKHHVVKI